MHTNSFDTLLLTAQDAAEQAGECLRAMWNKPSQIKSKGFRDVVTDADFAAQQIIVDVIHGRHPDHGFLTEEEDTALTTEGPITWIIDPLDGTTNFSRRIPTFCVSVAAVRRGQDATGGDWEVLSGAIYDPMRGEMFSAAAGHGCRLNGRPVHVSNATDMSEAVIALDWSHSRMLRQRALNTLNGFAHQVTTIRAAGSAALTLAWVAAGRLDGYLNFSLKQWDVAAGSLLIQEAGGRFSGTRGQAWDWLADSGGCVASNGRLHAQLLRCIANDLS